MDYRNKPFLILERLKEGRDKIHKRDILSEEQYTKFWMFMEYTYSKGKKMDKDGNKVIDSLAQRDKDELTKVTTFTKAMGVLYNTGSRPSELPQLKWSDIQVQKTDNAIAKKKNYN